MLNRDPVLQELNRRVIAERGVAATPVVKDFDVIEQTGDRFFAGGIARPMHAFVLEAVEEALSGALSQQLALRLIEQRMPSTIFTATIMSGAKNAATDSYVRAV